MRVVILGCGFGGVEVALALRKHTNEFELVMVDRSTRFDYQPAYPELLSGKVTPEEISADLSTFAAKIRASFLHAEVRDIKFNTQTVMLGSSPGGDLQELSYDFLVLALGAEQTFFGIPGAAEFSYTVDTMSATMEAKHALDQLLDYTKEPNIFVIGGGLSGIEVAGELVDYLKARDAHARIFLVEMMPRLLPVFPRENVGNSVSKFLRARGVEIMTNTAVQEVEERAITFRDGRKHPYELIIWTAGIKPSCFCEQLDLPKQRGWLKVDQYLRIDGVERVFAVGDAACFEAHGLRSGQNVEEAEAQGSLAATNILRTLQGARLRAYKPKNTIQNPRAIISLGDNKAVMYSKWFMFTTLAYRVKKFIERRYMKRFT